MQKAFSLRLFVISGVIAVAAFSTAQQAKCNFHFKSELQVFTPVLIKAIKAMSSLPFAMYTDLEARVTKCRALDFNPGGRVSCLAMHLLGSDFAS